MEQRVLVIDDEESIQNLLSRILEENGHRVWTAGTAQKAIELFTTLPFDVVLLDIFLPDMDGIELLKRFREARPHTAIIIITGKPNLDNATDALRLGAFDYLQKPLRREMVLKTVRNAGMLKSINDEKQRLEAENRQYQDRLERMVEEKTAALGKSEAKFRQFADFTNAWEYWIRPDKSAIYHSPSCETITGYPPETFMDDPDLLKKLTHPEDKDLLHDHFTPDDPRQPECRIEFRIISRKGETRWIAHVCHPVHDERGVFLGRRCSNRDITDRKENEQVLRRYERIVSSSHDMLAFVDRDGTYLAVNQAYADFVGQPIEKILGLRIPDVFDKALFQDVIEPRLERAFQGEKIVYQRPMVLGDGKTHHLDVAYYPHAEDNGAITGAVISLRDITHMKGMEAQLRQSQKMEAMGTLAGGIAHDFNNILSSIIGFSELLIMDSSENARSQESAEQILSAGHRARDLVKQILAFSRQSKTDRKPLFIHLIAKEALKMLRATLPSSIEIRQKIYPCAAVTADPTEIHQVFMNLCTNAAQAMPGGGRLTVALQNQTIPENLADGALHPPPGEYVCLTVSDTGHGMDPETQKRIFDPYFTTKETGEGTGLGLAMVHGIVKEMKGEILAESPPGKGAVFSIYFQTAGEGPAKRSHPGDIRAISGGTETILFVDDEVPITKLNQQRLSSLGYEVVAFTSSIKALAEFTAAPDRFDLIITDLTMPHMTGTVLAGEIRKIRKDIPILLCTGFSHKVKQPELAALGISGVIFKPVVIGEMDRQIRATLEAKSGTSPNRKGKSKK